MGRNKGAAKAPEIRPHHNGGKRGARYSAATEVCRYSNDFSLIEYLFSSRSHFRRGGGRPHCLAIWKSSPIRSYRQPRPKPLPVLEERHCGPNTVLILLLTGGVWGGCREIRAFSRPLCWNRGQQLISLHICAEKMRNKMEHCKVKRQKKQQKTEKKTRWRTGKLILASLLREYLMGAGPGAEGGGHLAWTRGWREV